MEAWLHLMYKLMYKLMIHEIRNESPPPIYEIHTERDCNTDGYLCHMYVFTLYNYVHLMMPNKKVCPVACTYEQYLS